MNFLIPFKGLSASKTRWQTDTRTKDELVVEMLRRSLQTVSKVVGSEKVHLVTPDPRAKFLFSDFQYFEVDGRGLNQDLTKAARSLIKPEVPVAVLLPDLPCLEVSDIEALLQASANHDVVLCPDEHEVGTNAVAFSSVAVLPFLFEGESFQRHLSAAQQSKLSTFILKRPGLAQDCDDLEALRKFCLI